VGLQRKAIDDLEKELNLAVSQLLGLFVKIMRKFATCFRSMVEGAVADTMPDANGQSNGAHDGEEETDKRFRPLEMTLDEDLAEGGAEVAEAERERDRARQLIDANLERYQLADSSAQDWEEAEKQLAKGKTTSIAVKGKLKDDKKRKPGEALAEAYKEAEKTREKKRPKKAKHQ